MPFAHFGSNKVFYELIGEDGLPVITFVNGLTQNASLWKSYADYFVPRGYRVLAYDMLGQGRSAKPIIDIALASHADLLNQLLDHLKIEKTHLVSISFGGVIALDFAVRFGRRLHSLVVMSSFAELTPHLEFLGAVMTQGLTDIGLPYLQNMLYPMNMSAAWIAANRERIPAMKRAGFIGNDGYAMQNLMESFVSFKPLTPNLHKIKAPTLIMNGEFDFFTPRECHELMRAHIANSRLLIIQHAYHAFTLEAPAVTMRQIDTFLTQVTSQQWQGDQTCWIASDDPAAPTQWLPIAGDWMRAVQVAAIAHAPPAKPAKTKPTPTRARKTTPRKKTP